MKIYHDDSIEVCVARCPCDMYIIKGVSFLQFPTSNKEVAQAFADSWAAKRQFSCHDDYDVDMSYKQPDYSLCKGCAKGLTGECEVLREHEEEKPPRE